ncbi:MAG: c-type cytochrome [Bryobacterales bacterium]|nr:c-type cytochrome [Bryobacterales bacterium]
MSRVFVVSVLALVLAGCGREKNQGALSPQEALKSFKLAEDFHVELFASEPDVVDPVDVAFDEYGRAYVADMLDLPDDPPTGKKPRGRIVMLQDTDGDGKADKSTIFAENVLQCSGLIPWKGGLIVPSSPEIYYMKDTNGDGKADIKEVLFTGFFHGNPEAQISNPRFGVDNWIYFSNTGNAGLIKSPKHPNQPPVEVRGFDFRYDPVRGRFEPTTGTAQYGLTMDDWGNRFISQNTTHLRTVVLPRTYLARAPLLEVSSPMVDPYGKIERRMYPLTEPQEWRKIRTQMRQQRYDELKSGRVEHLAGYFTGATGSMFYSGDAWPEDYKNSIFTGDVSGNLVRRDIVEPDGVTFKARPAPKTASGKVEFLASTDQWFRPTNFANAPDGNLYMMDMQREIIETPVSIPEELRKKLDFLKGDNIGRIYRIVSNQPRTKRGLQVNLGDQPSAELVKLLQNANGWHRETAHRLLYERQDKSVVPQLKEVALKGSLPAGRLRALYVLEGVGALDAATVEAALKDAQPEIREHAIRLAEAFPTLEKPVLALAGDKTPRIQLQLAFSLGNFKSPAAKAALLGLAQRNMEDQWIRTAVLTSVADAPGTFFTALMAKGPVHKDYVSRVGALIGTRHEPAEIQAYVTALGKTKDAEAGLAGVARGLKLAGARKLKAPGIEAALSQYLNNGVEAAWDVARYFELRGLVERAAQQAVAAQTTPEKRAAAVMALRGADFVKAQQVIDRVLASNPPANVQAASVLTLSSFEDAQVAPALLKHWKSYSPEARTKVIGAMLAQRNRVPVLLDALEENQVELAAVEIGARNRLLEFNDPKIADRAKKIFQNAAGSDRAKVVAAYKDVVNLKGDVNHGKQLFEDACAKCHLPRKVGGRVGPDLSGINMKSKEELLTAILDPSAAIEARFVNYLVTTKDGRMYDGVLANETPGAITLRGGSEEDVTILRSNIAEIRASSISLMPEDLEKALSKQGMADVIAYLRGGL